MITRLTRILLIVQLFIATGLFFLFGQVFPATAALVCGSGTVILGRALICGNNFLMAWRYRSLTPAAFQIGPIAALRLFATEFASTMTSSSWSMPFQSFTSRLSPSPNGLPVLLIHGYGCNSGYWHKMSKTLCNADVSHRAVSMEPVFGGIDEYVPLLHQAVEQLCRETGHQRIIVLAHSMGGLAARTYLRIHGSSRIAKVITLGTPHHGTALANFGLGTNTRQMHWTLSQQEGLSSEWLRELAASETPELRRLFVSIYSHHDNIISPQTSAKLEGAENIEFGGIGHVALAFDTRIHAQVLREIASTSYPSSLETRREAS